MGAAFRWKNRAYLAIYFAGALLALTAACGDSSPGSTRSSGPSSPGQQSGATSMPDVPAEPAATIESIPDVPVAPVAVTTESNPGTSPVVAAPTVAAPDAAPTTSPATPDPTPLPVLVNTPGPVANLAPDFTLPSIHGLEYTLSQYRGKQPVAVVFYRAYW